MKPRLPGDDLHRVLEALGELLTARGLHYEIVLVGGADLLLRGLAVRPTNDADALGVRLPSGQVRRWTELPAALATAVADVARAYGLPDDWLNLGPASLLDLGLPPGFETRLDPLEVGGLVVWLAGRYDLVCFKLYAAVDHWPSRDRHFQDLVALSATHDELLSAAAWARTHDPSPGFRSQLEDVLRHLEIHDADDRFGQ